MDQNIPRENSPGESRDTVRVHAWSQEEERKEEVEKCQNEIELAGEYQYFSML